AYPISGYSSSQALVSHHDSAVRSLAMSRQASFSRALVVSAAGTLSAAALLFAVTALAQQPGVQSSANSRVAANKVALQKFVDATNQLSPEVRGHLSRGLQNYLRYANAVLNGTAPTGNA